MSTRMNREILMCELLHSFHRLLHTMEVSSAWTYSFDGRYAKEPRLKTYGASAVNAAGNSCSQRLWRFVAGAPTTALGSIMHLSRDAGVLPSSMVLCRASMSTHVLTAALLVHKITSLTDDTKPENLAILPNGKT